MASLWPGNTFRITALGDVNHASQADDHGSRGDSLHKGPEMQDSDVVFAVRLGMQFNKYSSGRWLETPWCPCNVIIMLNWHSMRVLRRHPLILVLYVGNPWKDFPHWSMMTSSNGIIFRVTCHLCGHRWIPRTKASDAGLWYFLWFASVE